MSAPIPQPRAGRHGQIQIPSAWQILARNIKADDSQAAQILARLVLEASEPDLRDGSLAQLPAVSNAGGAAPAPPAPPSNESDER